MKIYFSFKQEFQTFRDLGGTEAERWLLGVGLLRVEHHQTFFFIQTQIASSGDVAYAEWLTPLHMPATPATESKHLNMMSNNVKS